MITNILRDINYFNITYNIEHNKSNYNNTYILHILSPVELNIVAFKEDRTKEIILSYGKKLEFIYKKEKDYKKLISILLNHKDENFNIINKYFK